MKVSFLVFLTSLIIKNGEGLLLNDHENEACLGCQSLSEEDFKESYHQSQPKEFSNGHSKSEMGPILEGKPRKKHRNVIRMSCDSETPIANINLQMNFEDDPDAKRHYFVLRKSLDTNKGSKIEYKFPEVSRKSYNKFYNNNNNKKYPKFLLQDDLFYKNINPLSLDELKEDHSYSESEKQVNKRIFGELGQIKNKFLHKVNFKEKYNNDIGNWDEVSTALFVNNSSYSSKNLDDIKSEFYPANDDYFYDHNDNIPQKSVIKRFPYLKFSQLNSKNNNESTLRGPNSENPHPVTDINGTNRLQNNRKNNIVNKLTLSMVRNRNDKKKQKSHLFHKISFLFKNTSLSMDDNSTGEICSTIMNTNTESSIQNQTNCKSVMPCECFTIQTTDKFEDQGCSEGAETKMIKLTKHCVGGNIVSQAPSRHKNHRREKVIRNLKFILSKGASDKKYNLDDDRERQTKRKSEENLYMYNDDDHGEQLESTEVGNLQDKENDYELYDNEVEEENNVLRKNRDQVVQNKRSKTRRKKLENSVRNKYLYNNHNQDSEGDWLTDGYAFNELSLDDYNNNQYKNGYFNEYIKKSPVDLSLDENMFTEGNYQRITKKVYIRKGKPLHFTTLTPYFLQKVISPKKYQTFRDIYVPRKYAHVYSAPINKSEIFNETNDEKEYKRFIRDVDMFKYLNEGFESKNKLIPLL